MNRAIWLFLLMLVVACGEPQIEIQTDESSGQQEVLPSWNEGPAKQRIIDFVNSVTDEDSPEFVPVERRIACFDNDGTLWSEKPLYFQLFFAFDRIRFLADDHPEWKDESPFREVLAGEYEKALSGGEEAIVELVMATHSGLSTTAFEQAVSIWIDTARHPVTGLRYPEMVYQPMLELLDYLRANDFTTFIVSGGGIDFMRPWASTVYGIPTHQIIGSMGKLRYDDSGEAPVIMKESGLYFLDDKEGKPIQIQRAIGLQPILIGGNSDGDYAMLRYATADNPHSSLGIIVHHTDAEREFAYDRESSVGRLNRGLDEVSSRGWLLIDMKEDWSSVWPSIEK